jgi:hypothetical protein
MVMENVGILDLYICIVSVLVIKSRKVIAKSHHEKHHCFHLKASFRAVRVEEAAQQDGTRAVQETRIARHKDAQS